MEQKKYIFAVKRRKMKYEIPRNFKSNLAERRRSNFYLPQDLKEITSHFISLYTYNKEFFDFEGEINSSKVNEIVKFN